MEENIEVTRDTYNLIAENFDVSLTTDNAAEGEIQYLNFFLSKIKEGGKIADLGCGAGKHSRYCSDKGFEVVGYDISEVMIERAKKHIKNEEALFFKISDMCDFESEYKFDGVVIAYSLMHLTKEQAIKTLKNLKKYTTEAAQVVIITLLGEGEGYYNEPLARDCQIFIKHYTQDEMEQVLRLAGYRSANYNHTKDRDPRAIEPDVLFVLAEKIGGKRNVSRST